MSVNNFSIGAQLPVDIAEIVDVMPYLEELGAIQGTGGAEFREVVPVRLFLPDDAPLIG
jgi:hypothetical protein